MNTTLEAFCKRFGMDPTLKVSEWQTSFQHRLHGWNAATEWKQYEIDVWRDKLKVFEKHERNARYENAKLRKVIVKATKAINYWGDKDDPLVVSFNKAKAGIDQREAEGDGDGT